MNNKPEKKPVKFWTHPEAKARIAELEAMIGKTTPQNAATPAALAAHRLAVEKSKETLRRLQAAKPDQPGKLTTAREFAGEPVRMSREEFRKLSAPDKARFLKDGGKIA